MPEWSTPELRPVWCRPIFGFLFEHGDALAGKAFEEAVGGGEANDAAADDDEVGRIHGKR